MQGLMWQGRDQVAQAKARFVERFGCAPDTVYVHPSQASGENAGLVMKLAPKMPGNYVIVTREDGNGEETGSTTRLA